jgi:hypothetical protein
MEKLNVNESSIFLSSESIIHNPPQMPPAGNPKMKDHEIFCKDCQSSLQVYDRIKFGNVMSKYVVNRLKPNNFAKKYPNPINGAHGRSANLISISNSNKDDELLWSATLTNFNGPNSKSNNYIVSGNGTSDHWKKDLNKLAKIIHSHHGSSQLRKQQKKAYEKIYGPERRTKGLNASHDSLWYDRMSTTAHTNIFDHSSNSNYLTGRDASYMSGTSQGLRGKYLQGGPKRVYKGYYRKDGNFGLDSAGGVNSQENARRSKDPTKMYLRNLARLREEELRLKTPDAANRTRKIELTEEDLKMGFGSNSNVSDLKRTTADNSIGGT